MASLPINLDIPWNPAGREQRIGRIYRIGQKRNVSIINRVSTGTIEHKMLGVLNFKKGLAEGILDQGDNTIFMADSKFKVLMNSVEEMIVSVDETQPAQINHNDEYSVEEQDQEQDQVQEQVQQQDNPLIPSFLGDDDEIPHEEASEKVTPEAGTPNDLIQTGLSFLGKLAQTLSSTEATQQLVSSIVQKDEKDGKTYLKIPIENEKVVENFLVLFAGIFNQKKI